MKWSPICLLLGLPLVGCGSDAALPNITDLSTLSADYDFSAPESDAAPTKDNADLASMSRPTDDDADGLPDDEELQWAKDYLPYISNSPQDKCPVGGLLVRVSPHPTNTKLIHILYDYLYDEDCGLGGHPGDDEVFAITIDPSQPPPMGIVAMKAISHQGTPCERDSTCGKCVGLTDCATLMKNGEAWPAVWPSRDKHGSYVNKSSSCQLFGTCFDQCDDNNAPTVPPIVNAGEPGHPLTSDLTDHGFITTANGWKNMELFHFDPWKDQDFGGAGNVSKDLVDTAFDTPGC